MRKSTLFLFFSAVSCGLLPAQTLTMLSGNGQLNPTTQSTGSEPLVFKVTSSSDPNSTGVPGQLITFTTSNGIIPLSEYSVVTGADGTASVTFLPATEINGGASYVQYSLAASLNTKPPIAIPFYETSFGVSPDSNFQYAQTQLVSPTNLTTVPYQAQAGTAGTKIQILIYVAGGFQSGQSIGNVAVRPVLLPPFGTGSTVQSVRCKEASPADYEGNVYSAFPAGSIVTCTPIFALPNAVFAPGTNSFQFEILVGDHFVYGPITYNVTVAPVTLAGGLINAEAPFPATQLVAAGGFPPYTFSIAGGALPAGVTLNAQTGVVSGTPTGTPGIYPYTVRVQDSTGTSATLPQSIAVSGGPVTPSVPLIAYVGEKVSSTISFTGGVPPLTVKSVTGLPVGLTDTIQSGGSVLISGTAPMLTTPTAVTFSGVDATGATFIVPVALQVAPDLTATGPNPQTLTVGQVVTTISVTPANGVAPYTFAATGLPAGLAITPTGTISGTVTAAPGKYTATVTVTDSLGEVQTLMPVFYVESSALAIVPASVPAAFAGLPYTTTLQFTGGVPLSSTPPYTVALAATGVPAGVTLVNGVLAGLFPTAGTVDVPIVVTDGTGISAPIQLAVVVQNVAVVNAGSFINGSVVAPGEIVSIFGSGFGPAAGVSGTIDATTGSLATTLAGVQVLFGSTPAPIFFENATQINVQVPYEATAGSKVPVVISINGTPYTVVASLSVAESSPGLFAEFPATGYTTGAPIQAIALNYPASTLNTATNPVARGSYIVLYATGGGTLSTPLADGLAAGTDPLITLTDNPQVTIGGQPATVSFAGLAPGFIGLIQVNALVPETVTPGSAVPVILTFGGSSNQAENATIAVQ